MKYGLTSIETKIIKALRQAKVEDKELQCIYFEIDENYLNFVRTNKFYLIWVRYSNCRYVEPIKGLLWDDTKLDDIIDLDEDITIFPKWKELYESIQNEENVAREEVKLNIESIFNIFKVLKKLEIFGPVSLKWYGKHHRILHFEYDGAYKIVALSVEPKGD